MTAKQPNVSVWIGVILLVALAFRLACIGFGLPAMYDPDEPFFVLKAFHLVDQHTLNPGWFGHPGTTTLYLLALIDVAVAGVGLASGRFANLPDFAAAVYAHPGLIWVPSRVAMALIGVGTVWLTFLLARRLFDGSTGLLAAAFLALNALHIAWSQIIRTDINASLFMLASMLFAGRAAQDGRMRSLLVAALFGGVATATKWPGASALLACGGAALHLWRGERDPLMLVRRLIMAGLAAIVGLFIASPFILIDWRTALGNVGGEVATGHLGHNGAGLLADLAWYGHEQIVWSMGWIGLALTLVGLILIVRQPIARVTLLPVALLFLVVISAQVQIWSRWLTPVLPMLCIAAAFATVRGTRWVAARAAPRWSPLLRYGLPALAILPSAAGAIGSVRERAEDTRDQASVWAIAHIPPGSSVVVEHLALNLRSQPWTILFPIGAAGCIDGRDALKKGVRIEGVQQARRGSPIIDIGNTPSAKLDTCHGDYAILTYFDLYLAEGKTYPAQLDIYRQLIGTGRTLAVFRPIRGAVGGPVTRIVSLRSKAG